MTGKCSGFVRLTVRVHFVCSPQGGSQYTLSNVFGALTSNDSDGDDAVKTVATQVAALAYQSQLMATTAANSSRQMGQCIQTLAHQQELLHQNQHQMMEQMAALSFNQSNAGRGIGRPGRGQPQPPAPFTPNGFKNGGQGRGRGCGHDPPGFATGRGPPKIRQKVVLSINGNMLLLGRVRYATLSPILQVLLYVGILCVSL